jgi:hypothetical protein
LRSLQLKDPVRRYQLAQLGDMIHIDTKQLAGFRRVGHRITGDRHKVSSPGAGYEKAHVAVDDATRVAYVEVLPDEQKAMTVGFLVRAVSWFHSQGITCCRVLSDNGSAYRSRQWRQACMVLSSKESQTHQGLQAPGQREGLTIHQNPASRMGLCDAIYQLRIAQALVAALSGDL